MAIFDLERTRYFLHEGGESNNKDDRGGHTFYGVSAPIAALFPDFQANPTPDGAWAIIKQNYWSMVQGDSIPNQKLAGNLLDFCVTSGDEVVKQIQLHLNTIFGQALKVDGRLGPVTLTAILSSDQAKLNRQLCMSRIDFYVELAKKDPTQYQFLHSWLWRTLDYL